MKLPKVQAGDCVLVTWEDAWTDTNDPITTEEATENEPLVMEEIGFVMAYTRQGLSLSTSRMAIDAKGRYRYTHFIPKKMLKSIEVLKSSESQDTKEVPLEA